MSSGCICIAFGAGILGNPGACEGGTNLSPPQPYADIFQKIPNFGQNFNFFHVTWGGPSGTQNILEESVKVLGTLGGT